MAGEVLPGEGQHFAGAVDLQLGLARCKRIASVVGQQPCRLAVDQVAVKDLGHDPDFRHVTTESADHPGMFAVLLPLLEQERLGHIKHGIVGA